MFNALRVLFVMVWTGVWATAALPVVLVDRSGEGLVWMVRHWARQLLAGCGVRVVAEGVERVDGTRPHVFMSNHLSHFDTLAIVATLPVSFRFVAKRELTRIPIFGWVLVLGGHVIVDRGDRAASVRRLARAQEQIRDGANVIIFPEGTRSPDGALQPFKSGGFHLALGAGVDIVPVSVSGSHRITPKRSLRIDPGLIKVVYGDAVPTAGLDRGDRDALVERVRAAIAAGLDAELQGAPAARPDASGTARARSA